jgi:hypothetical protein
VRPRSRSRAHEHDSVLHAKTFEARQRLQIFGQDPQRACVLAFEESRILIRLGLPMRLFSLVKFVQDSPLRRAPRKLCRMWLSHHPSYQAGSAASRGLLDSFSLLSSEVAAAAPR